MTKQEAIAEIWRKIYHGGLTQRELALGELWNAAIEAAAEKLEDLIANGDSISAAAIRELKK